MEERGLLRERLQAITEKHRVQEDIRLKKQELDQEKLKVQHLKKRCLREQWLLQDSSSHNATESPRQQKLLSDQQQTRALERNIFRIEKELESLEREESLISTNESFILNRLKVVEKTPEDIIKEAQKSFVADASQFNTEILKVSDTTPDDNTAEKDLFAMEISVAKNLLTGESTVLSATRVHPEDIHQNSGQKVYEDSRSCIYALNSQEDSRRPSRISVLSADEVDQLLRNAAQNKVNLQHSAHNHHRGAPCCSYKDEQGNREGPLRPNLNHHSTNNKIVERDSTGSRSKVMLEELRRAQQERQKSREARKSTSFFRCGHKDQLLLSHQSKRCCVQDNLHGNHHTCRVTRSCSSVSHCPPPRSHDPEEVCCHHPRLRYTPASHIPLDEYVSVDKEQVYCYNGLPAHSDRAPSPLCEDDAPYTILNSLDTSEPITAIFMGFQTTEDDRSRDFEGSLKAELIVINDETDEKAEKNRAKQNQQQGQRIQGAAVSSSVNGGTQKQLRPSVRKLQKKHKACCSVC